MPRMSIRGEEDGGEKKKGMREHMLANSGCICFFPYPGRKGKGRGERERGLSDFAYFFSFVAFFST